MSCPYIIGEVTGELGPRVAVEAEGEGDGVGGEAELGPDVGLDMIDVH